MATAGFFMLLLFKDRYHTVHNTHREQAAMGWLHLQATLASGHTHLSCWCWCILTNHHVCRLLILASSFRDFAMLSSRHSAHIPKAHSFICSEPPHVLPKTAAITSLLLNLHAIHFFCKMFQRLYAAPSCMSLFIPNKIGQPKKRKRRKQCSKSSVLDSGGTCLTEFKTLSTQS